MTEVTSRTRTNRFNFRTLILLLIPILLLIGVIVLFLSTGGGLKLESPAPSSVLNRYFAVQISSANATSNGINPSPILCLDAYPSPTSAELIHLIDGRRRRTFGFYVCGWGLLRA